MIKQLIEWIEANDRTVSTLMGALVVLVVCIAGYEVVLGNKLRLPSSTGVEYQLAPDDADTGVVTHTVLAGEGLSSIAVEYYGNKDLWTEIARANNIANPNLIEVGQELIIPKVNGTTITPSPTQSPSQSGEQRIHVVRRGDYLSKLAIQYYGNKDRWVDIYNANKGVVKNPEILVEGTRLVIP